MEAEEVRRLMDNAVAAQIAVSLTVGAALTKRLILTLVATGALTKLQGEAVLDSAADDITNHSALKGLEGHMSYAFVEHVASLRELARKLI